MAVITEQGHQLARARRWLDGAPAWATFLVVFLPLLALYIPSSEREYQNIDTIAVSLPAWQLAKNGNLTLDEFDDIPWIVEAKGRLVSNRPPGLIAHALPFYAIAAEELDGPIPSQTPNALAAALIAAAAMGTIHIAFRALAPGSVAVGGALLFGVTTTTWTYSADQLWPHGPAQLWLALTIVAVAHARYIPAGLSLAVGVLTRPVLAVVAATIGLGQSFLRRDLRPVLFIGFGSLAGLILLMAYNQHVFGAFSPVTASYGESFVTTAVSRTPFGYLANLAGFFVSRNSFLLWSPIVIPLLLFAPAAWKKAPDWVKTAAVAGAVYLLVHAALNRQSGGTPHNYRYPLEMLTLMSPLLVIAFQERIAKSDVLLKIFATSATLAFLLQFLEAWKSYIHPALPEILG